MKINKNHLTPFKSYLIFENKKKFGNVSQKEIFRSFLNILENSFEYKSEVISSVKNVIEDISCFQHVLKVKSESPWLNGNQASNLLNTNYILMIVSYFNGWTFVNISENSLLNKIHTFFSGTSSHEDVDYKKISKFMHLADNNSIQLLLPKNSQINTFWLSGTHKSTTLKADSKSLAGQDLEQALDPQEDQSFHYTSARYSNSVNGKVQKAGVSPSKSRVWYKRSKNIYDFILTGKEIVNILNNPKEKKELKILTKPTNIYNTLGNPADIVFYADFITPDELNDESDFLDCTHVEFNLVSKPRLSSWDPSIIEWKIKKYITAELFYLGRHVCSFNIQLAFEDGKNPLIKIKDIDLPKDSTNKEVIKKILRVNNLKIWFDSHHTLSQKQLYENQYKDVTFDFDSRAIYINFGQDTSLTKEKPNINGKYFATDIGKDNSLFCWLKNNNIPELGYDCSKGILICDDGAGEISDFIYIHDNSLVLFHIKAAQTDGAQRRISNGAFEVVCGQAIKNIKFGDIANIKDRLLNTKRDSRKVWANGKETTLSSALKNYNKEKITKKTIVIMQPHLLKKKILNLKERGYNQILLEALLVSVLRNCMANGIEFKVIGSVV